MLPVSPPVGRSTAQPTEVSALARVQPALPRINSRHSRGLNQLDPDEYEEVEEDEDGRKRRKSSRRRGPPLGGGELNQEVELPPAPVGTGGGGSQVDTFSFLDEGIEAGSVTSLTLSVPNPADADRLLLLVIQNRADAGQGEQPSVSGWTLIATEVDGTGIDDRMSLWWRSMTAGEGSVAAAISTSATQVYIIGHVFGVVGVDLNDPIVQVVERNAGVIPGAGSVTLTFAAFASATNFAFTAGIGINDEDEPTHATVAGFALISEGTPNPDGAVGTLAFGRESEIASAIWTHQAGDTGNVDLKVAVEVRRA